MLVHVLLNFRNLNRNQFGFNETSQSSSKLLKFLETKFKSIKHFEWANGYHVFL